MYLSMQQLLGFLSLITEIYGRHRTVVRIRRLRI